MGCEIVKAGSKVLWPIHVTASWLRMQVECFGFEATEACLVLCCDGSGWSGLQISFRCGKSRTSQSRYGDRLIVLRFWLDLRSPLEAIEASKLPPISSVRCDKIWAWTALTTERLAPLRVLNRKHEMHTKDLVSSELVPSEFSSHPTNPIATTTYHFSPEGG